MHVCSPLVPSLFVSSDSESSQTYWRLHSSCSIDFPWRRGLTKPIGSYVETCGREDTAFRVHLAPQQGIRNYRIRHTIELLGCILGGLHQIFDPSFFNSCFLISCFHFFDECFNVLPPITSAMDLNVWHNELWLGEFEVSEGRRHGLWCHMQH